MRKWLLAPVAVLLLAAAPALAAPCKTQGEVDAPIAFPKNDASDVPFSRSMVPVILPDVSDALPRSLTCTRATIGTRLGDYVIGGENGEAFPRMALPADGKPGPAVYLAAPAGSPGAFALVVHRKGSLTVIKRFYAGIPTDLRLAEDIRAALADDDSLISYEPERQMVSHNYDSNGIPPPSESGVRPDGTTVTAGPQIFIPDSGDPRMLDMDAHLRHKPSGFACPETFDGLAVMLMSVEPKADYLACSYRAGTSLAYREDDPIRYELTLIKAPGETPRSIFDELTKQGRAALRIKGDHPLPLATGPAPAPELAAFWDTEGDGVQGLWVGKAGGWLMWLRAQYPPGAANDAEAGKVAQALFTELARQVK